MKYDKLRDAAREHLASTPLRINHTEGSAMGIWIGELGPVKGHVTFVDETGIANFAPLEGGQSYLIPLDQIIPGWITAIKGKASGKEVGNLLEKLDKVGIMTTEKLKVAQADVLASMQRRKLAASEMIPNVGFKFTLTPLGSYLLRETDVWR